MGFFDRIREGLSKTTQQIVHRFDELVSQSEAPARKGRPVDVETIAVNPFTGRIAVAGLRVHERDGEEPLAELARLDARIKPLSLLAGHVWIRDAVFEAPTIRVVRYGDTFNFSDLLEREPSDGRALDTTVDRIVVTRGLVTLEDRALTEPRTWRAESIEIEGKNISTRRDDGTLTARSVTAGTSVSAWAGLVEGCLYSLAQAGPPRQTRDRWPDTGRTRFGTGHRDDARVGKVPDRLALLGLTASGYHGWFAEERA